MFCEQKALILSTDSEFAENFAAVGGVLYLQNDGELRLTRAKIVRNLAYVASIASVYNSLNPLYLNSGYISDNGFDSDDDHSSLMFLS